MRPLKRGRSETRRIVVTGAGAGIGRALATRFAKRGWRVGAFDVDEEALASLSDEAGGDGIVTAALDVTNPEAWQRGLEGFCGDEALDVLVNNAGILYAGEFAASALEPHLRTVDVNVKGTLIGCHAAHPYLMRAGAGQVVNMCSASAIYGQAELATYSATKFAVRGLSEALDLEWRPQGIRVQAMWPLFVETGMTRGMDIGTTRSLGIRLGPDDVARTVERAIMRPRLLDGVLPIHRAAGAQAKVLLASSAMSPSWVLRQVNRRLGER